MSTLLRVSAKHQWYHIEKKKSIEIGVKAGWSNKSRIQRQLRLEDPPEGRDNKSLQIFSSSLGQLARRRQEQR